MSKETAGSSADVTVNKLDESNNIVDSSGDVDDGISTVSKIIFILMIGGDVLGIWKILELIQVL